MKNVKSILLALTITFFLAGLNQAAAHEKEVLTNQHIIKMVKAGLDSTILIAKINDSDANFDLSTDGLIALKQAGVRDEVIQAMMEKQSQQASKAQPQGTAETKKIKETPKATEPAESPKSTSVATVPPQPASAATETVSEHQFKEAEYITVVPGQDKQQAIKGTLIFDSKKQIIRYVSYGKIQFTIPYKKIVKMFHDRTAKPRFMLGLMKAHYLTIYYNAPDKKEQSVTIRLHKSNYQQALETAEAETSIAVIKEK